MSTAAPLQKTAAKSPLVSKASHAGLLLQRKCACGGPASLKGECEECNKKRLQKKLSIGASNDPLEQEADRVADQVLAISPSSGVSSSPPRIQRFGGQATGDIGSVPASVDRVLSSPGRPLGPELLQDMGQRFGYDFSRVQIHTGAEAQQSARDVNAHAYTAGNNIVFGINRFAPESNDGRRLIAHELTHVVQQNGKAPAVWRKKLNESYRAQIVSVKENDGIVETCQDVNGKDCRTNVLTPGMEVMITEEFVGGAWLFAENLPESAVKALHGQKWIYVPAKYVEHLPAAKAKPPTPKPEEKSETKPEAAAPSVTHAKLRLQNARRLGRSRVDAAIELARRAIVHATDTPPDSERALDILHKVEKFLDPFVADSNLRKYYSGFSGMAAREIAGGGVAAVKTLQGLIRTGMNASEGGRNGGLWDYHYDRLAMARDYLVILSGDEEKSIAHWGPDEKITAAIQRAIPKLPGEVGERLKELLTPQSLALIAAFAAAYVFSQTTPIGWAADIVVAGLIVATVLMVGEEAIEVVKLLLTFVDRAVGAKSEEDLDAAGQALATAITKVGVDVVVAILLHKAGKAANLSPPGPRSPGLIEVIKTTGEKVTTAVTEPAASGWLVTPEGVRVWPPGEPPPGTVMMEGKGGGVTGDRGSAGSGKGSPSPAGKGAGEGKGTAPPGRDLATAGGLPKEKPPAKPKMTVDEPARTGKTAAEPTLADTTSGTAAEPQTGVKQALASVTQRIAKARAELAEKAKELSTERQQEWALRKRIENTPTSDPGRAALVEKLKAEQSRIAELQREQDHRLAEHDKDVATRVRLKEALDAKTYARPGFTVAERAKIWDQARKDGGGKVLSPSGKEIKPGDPWEVGHKPKYEFWKHARSAAERGITREQFLRECKELDQYRPETPEDNNSHAYEDKTDAYDGH